MDCLLPEGQEMLSQPAKVPRSWQYLDLRLYQLVHYNWETTAGAALMVHFTGVRTHNAGSASLVRLAWGSIMSGQRRALDTMMPFSTDTLSVGSPAMVHARTWAGASR
jgi:hypothetical protein